MNKEEEELCEEALKYAIVKWNLNTDRLRHWGMCGIVNAGPTGFKFKDDHSKEGSIEWSIWNLRVEYYVNKNILLFKKDFSCKDMACLESNFYMHIKNYQCMLYPQYHDTIH